MSGRLDDARQEIEEAWLLRTEAQPYIVPRLVFFRLLFALLDGSNPPPEDRDRAVARHIGRLKTALQPENAHTEWDVQAVLNHLATWLDTEQLDLLRAIVAALGDRTHLSALDRFTAWRAATPQPLE